MIIKGKRWQKHIANITLIGAGNQSGHRVSGTLSCPQGCGAWQKALCSAQRCSGLRVCVCLGVYV